MKFNWKFAVMAFAAFALVACNTNPEPNPNPGTNLDEQGEGGNEGDIEEPDFVSPITIDGNFADWDALDASKVASATCAPGCSKWQALTSVKVYADAMYINILGEFNESIITDREWVPFHVYLDADGSAETGGYGDEFADADTEVLLEGGIISESAFATWDPAYFKWWGEVGGSGWEWTDPSVEHSDADGWGAIIPEGTGNIAKAAGKGNKFEIQILREMIPTTFAKTFGIGFDIQQNWTSVGVLPNADDADDASQVLAPKLRVTIDE